MKKIDESSVGMPLENLELFTADGHLTDSACRSRNTFPSATAVWNDTPLFYAESRSPMQAAQNRRFPSPPT